MTENERKTADQILDTTLRIMQATKLSGMDAKRLAVQLVKWAEEEARLIEEERPRPPAFNERIPRPVLRATPKPPVAKDLTLMERLIALFAGVKP